MPLINFQTDLKSLAYGRDRRSSGDSNQPYVTEEIPDSLTTDDLPVRSGPDFIVRGGLKAVSNALDDVARLGKMFIDLKSPSGLLFIAKENLLSRTSVKTPASFGAGYAGGGEDTYFFDENVDGLAVVGGGNINQGVYTPVSTLAAALGTGLGVHPNLLGIDPFSPISGVVQGSLFGGNLSLNTYESATKSFNEESSGNRLVIFYDRATTTAENENSDVNIYSYSGGPGSVLGIGRTNIRFSDQRTGGNNIEGKGIIAKTYQVNDRPFQTSGSFTYDTKGLGVENATRKFYNTFSDTIGSNISPFYGDGGNAIDIGPNGPYQTFAITPQSGSVTNFDILYKNNSRTFSQPQLISQENVIEGTQAGLYPTDFRKQLYTSSVGQELPPTTDSDDPTIGGSQISTVLSISPSYRNKNKDVRLNQGQPGKEGGRQRDAIANSPVKNVWNYGVEANKLEALDKITAQPMYSGVGPDTNLAINDLCKFRIAAINNDATNGSAVYMHFRAFLDSFSDAYNATWTPVQYVGRGEPLYNYGGFGRTITMGFTAAAQSKAELIPMYKKLNYLASTLAPDYTEAGFMRGNLVRLTVGGYLYEQPGFITSLTYDIPQETTWEIALKPDGGADRSVKELPHMIKVSSLQFTPIHNFLAQKPNNANNPTSRYIALSNAPNSRGNYATTYEPYQKTGDNDNNSGNDIPGE